MPTIALIGTGKMGAGIALNLLRSAYSLVVWNRTQEKTRSLIDAGAKLAKSPAQAADQADFIITCVQDDESSRSIWIGPHGILSGKIKPGALAIECTTISLGWVLELEKHILDASMRFLDCPLTGGPGGARSGVLTLLVGARKEDLEDATPILQAFSNNILHFGLPGAGTRYKLLSNLMGAVQIMALAEGLTLAKKAGMNMELVLEGLTTGGVSSPLVKGFAYQMMNDKHDFVNFSVKSMQKDTAYGAQIAEDLGLSLPLSLLTTTILQSEAARALGKKNISALIDIVK